jgi:aspartyl-tRNA(Asn)/glutamyl-tRNA(Gln) amidotransferase subunit B
MPRDIREYKVLIGLEIHVQLATRTKMFTAVANAAGALKPGDPPPEPNSAVDEQVLGLPGTLPVINRRAVEYAIMAGIALGCRINSFTKWDRKGYYYPDLPKNYQISQYDLPLCEGGMMEVEVEGTRTPLRIRRAHLEEDAGKLLHEAPGGRPIPHSIVDLNRAGTPLLEIVTEPDLSTPQQVVAFAQELQRIVRFIGVSEAQMQLGHMRFEPNINLHITDSEGVVHKTAITEIKNLNSFSVLERATAYEINRQLDAFREDGSLGKKSTRGWDEASGTTFLQREKEEANDYRYFPDPDLPPVVVDEAWLNELKSRVGELPATRRTRYVQALGLNRADAAALSADRKLGDFYEEALSKGADAKRVANLLINVVATIANKKGVGASETGIRPEQVCEVAQLIDAGKISASSALPLFEAIPQEAGVRTSVRMSDLAEQLDLIQSTDTGAIDAAIDALIAENSKSLQDFRAGKQQALGALVGAVMKSAKGLNPKLVQERLRSRLTQ